jgi:hypothetical protein
LTIEGVGRVENRSAPHHPRNTIGLEVQILLVTDNDNRYIRATKGIIQWDELWDKTGHIRIRYRHG